MENIYQIVTDRIISELEAGRIPWQKPWISFNGGAFNRISGRRYSTLNQMLLSKSGEYATFNQWASLKATIKQGSKSELVTFWKMPEVTEEDDTEGEGGKKKPRPVLKYYRVFHISQVEGVEPLEHDLPGKNLGTDEEAERVFSEYISRENIRFVRDIDDRAYYSPANDLIHLPHKCLFQSMEQYYGTLFHEACHSTGHESRLNRAGIQNVSFGSETYSREELIAEVGSACMIAGLGLNTAAALKNSAAYIQGWLSVLKDDPRMVVSAAGQAEKAVKFILNGDSKLTNN